MLAVWGACYQGRVGLARRLTWRWFHPGWSICKERALKEDSPGHSS